MAMYTALWGTVVLNDVGRRIVSRVMDQNKTGLCWRDFLEIPKDFLDDERNMSIPFGRNHMTEYGDSPSYEEQVSSLDGNIWNLACSLPNYGGTIQKFVDLVLPIIAESFELNSRYEEHFGTYTSYVRKPGESEVVVTEHKPKNDNWY